MNSKSFTSILLVGFIFITSQAFAGDKMSDRKKDRKEHYQMMAGEHHRDMDKVLTILTETMTIIKNLNHKPSGSEKTRLGEMIGEIANIQKRSNDRRDQMQKMMNMDMMDMNMMGGDN